MHPIAWLIVLLCASGIYACGRRGRNLRKQLHAMAFDRPAHATAEEEWAWEVKFNDLQKSRLWPYLASSAMFIVLILGLISAVTGATGP